MNNKDSALVNDLVNGITLQMKLVLGNDQDPGRAISICASASTVSLMGIVQAISKYDDIADFRPTEDHMLMGCLLHFNCLEVKEHLHVGIAMSIGFELEAVLRAMDQFQKLTGRSFEPLMNNGLVQVLNEVKENANKAFTGDMRKFLPN